MNSSVELARTQSVPHGDHNRNSNNNDDALCPYVNAVGERRKCCTDSRRIQVTAGVGGAIAVLFRCRAARDVRSGC